jgi:Na+/citrate or Na+/malate symporter
MNLFVRIIVFVLFTVTACIVTVTALSSLDNSLDNSLLSDIILIFIGIASAFIVRVAYGALLGKSFKDKRPRGLL